MISFLFSKCYFYLKITSKINWFFKYFFTRFKKIINLYGQKFLIFLFTCSIFFASFSTEGNKANYYLINIFFSLYIVIALLWFQKNKISLKIRNDDIFLLFLYFFVIFQSFLNNSFLYHKSIYISLFIFFLFFFVGKNLLQGISKQLAIWYFTCSCLLFSLWHYFQIILYVFLEKNINVYISNHFGNTGTFAIFLAITSLFFIYYVFIKKKFITKIIFSFSFLFNLILIIYLESRTSFFIFVFFPMMYFSFHSIKRKRMLWIYFLGSVIFIFLLSLYKQPSTEGRLLIWKCSLDLIKNNFFFGTGFNSFPFIYPLYQGKYYDLAKMTSKEILLADNTITAFNEPLQIFCELGFVGFLIIYLFFIYILVQKNGSILIKFIFLSICFSSLFYYVFHNTLLITLTLISLTILLSENNPSFIIRHYYLKYIYPFIILFCVCSFHLFSQKYQAIKTFEEIKKYGNIIFFSNYTKSLLDNPIFLLSYSYELYKANKFEDALKILKMLDNYVVWYHSKILEGDCYNKLKNIKNTEKLYKQAVSICPGKFVARHKLLNFYIKNNMHQKALEEAKKIVLLPEKIPSAITLAIKLEAKTFLENNTK